MTLSETSGIPLYRQLSQLLKDKILSGELAPKQKIPSEPELCSQYGISRMTVRLALEELRKDGYIYRMQGKGTFISLPKIEQRLSSFYSFTDDIEKMGYKISKDIIHWGKKKAGKGLSAKLMISPDDGIFVIERILYCNEHPFAVETSHIPVRHCASLTKELVAEKGLYRSLNSFGIYPNNATETFEAVILDSKHKTLLKTADIAPGFFVKRISFSSDMPIEYCEGYVNGESVKYNIILK